MQFTQDINEQRRNDEANRLFRALMDQACDGVEVIDPETGFFLDVNAKTCLMHGYTREEYLVLSVFDIDLKHAWDKLPDRESLLGRTNQAGFCGFETSRRRKDGSTFPVEVTISFIRLERDYLLAVVRDITGREQVMDEMKRALANTKTMRSLLPICCVCKKIRDKEGGWQQMETYMTRHASVKFSHTYCPECSVKWCAEITRPAK